MISNPIQQQKPTSKNPQPFRGITSAAVALAALWLVPTAMAAESGALAAADESFVKQEAAAGKSLLKVAELGIQKSGSADLKAFARDLVAEQTRSNNELDQLAQSKGVELSAVINPRNAEAFQKLEKLEGTEFDRAFLATVAESRKHGIDDFAKSSKDSKSSELKTWVDDKLPSLKASLARAEEIAAN